jgi:methyl-accepting chemotaxis protein
LLIRRRTGDDGVIATHMAITVAFALFAVTQLTRTTVAAQEIDTRVSDIVGSVDDIDEETKPVAVLDETGRLTDEILAAAVPLENQTVEINSMAKEINGNVEAILGNANAINGTVNGIGNTVGEINGTVRAINDTAKSINGNAKGILGTLQKLQPTVVSINDGVAGINRRADVVIGLSRGIKSDTGNILIEVRRIEANATAICNAAIVSGGC